MEDLQNYLTPKQLAEAVPFLTEGKIRFLLFHRDQNGLDEAVYKVSGRLVIHLEEFLEWMKKQRA